MHANETLRRDVEITLDRGAVNTAQRTVEVSFSSETPIERFFGTEILDHSQGAVDMTRLNAGGAVLVDHNVSDQVGVVEKAWLGSDRKGRAKLRFSKSTRGQEVFQDVVDGIRRLISVGYAIGKTVKEGDGVRAVSWTPYEISLVSVPADTSVGVGRALLQKEHTFMNAVKDIRADELSAIGQRLAGKVPNIEELATRAILDGTSVEDFRAAALAAMPKCVPLRTAPPLEFNQKDWNRYSLTRAISSRLPDSNIKFDGIEREVHDEVCIKRGMKPEGFWIAPEVLAANMTRSFVAGTGTLGGNIVETSNLGEQFIELLRNRAQVARLGGRILTLDNPVTIPRRNGAGAANWVGETVASTLSVGSFTQVTLQPNGLSAFQQYSKQLLATNNPSIDMLIRDDILAILGLAIDLAALHGTGSGQPTGIAGTTGIGTVTLATNGQALGNSTAYPALVSLETALGNANADAGTNMAYLMRATHRASLKTQARFSNTDTPVFQSVPGSLDGICNGYRAAVTNQIATNLTTGTATTICSAIFFGNWSEVLIGQFNGGAIDMVVDPYTLAVNGVVRLIARQWVDIAVRHAASFAVLGGIL
jgi:HK97 family phage major capsid protein